MDQILDIELTIDGDKLRAVDKTLGTLLGDNLDAYYEYFVEVEFLAHRTEDNVLPNIIMKRPQFQTISVSEFELEYNGIYYYHKICVPILEYFLGKSPDMIVGEIFVDENGNLQQIMDRPKVDTIEGILEVSNAVSCIHAYNAIVRNMGADYEANESYFFPKKEVFSTCKIRKCLVYLQHKMLLENCSSNSCSANAELRNTRDFLFGAMYVLNYLKETNNFEEAQRIVDNLSTCNFPCDEDSITANNCGCGNYI